MLDPQLMDFLLSGLTTLLVTIDPIGLAPIFMSLTIGMTAAQRRHVGFLAVTIGIVVLSAFALGGAQFLGLLGISLSAFRIAGGLLLFTIAFEMVFGLRQARKQETAGAAITTDQIRNIAAFPLAVPMIAGPGAMTATILLAGQADGDPAMMAALFGNIIFVCLLALVTFLAAAPIERLLGQTVRSVLTRLLGVILAALAVQFVADGVRAMVLTG